MVLMPGTRSSPHQSQCGKRAIKGFTPAMRNRASVVKSGTKNCNLPYHQKV